MRIVSAMVGLALLCLLRTKSPAGPGAVSVTRCRSCAVSCRTGKPIGHGNKFLFRGVSGNLFFFLRCRPILSEAKTTWSGKKCNQCEGRAGIAAGLEMPKQQARTHNVVRESGNDGGWFQRRRRWTQAETAALVQRSELTGSNTSGGGSHRICFGSRGRESSI
jgi:hypothetical protein